MAEAEPALAVAPPLVKAEHDFAPPPSLPGPSSETQPMVIQETQGLTNTTNRPPAETPENQETQHGNLELPPPSPLQFINFIAQRQGFSTALSAFERCYDDLRQHLEFIRTPFNSRLPQNRVPPPSLPQPSSDTRPLFMQETPTETPQLQQLPSPSPPQFINSMAQLQGLSTAISAFQRCYDDLSQHLEFIWTSINSKSPQNLTLTQLPSQDLEIVPVIEIPSASTEKALGPELTQSDLNESNENKSSWSELENLCRMMCSRDLRKYLVSHLGEVSELREEVPKALKLARNPAKLVLECSGRFFLQGSKAFYKDSPMIPAREASVLVLEFFLMMDREGLEIEAAVKAEAGSAALAWRKRLINEGGVAKASQIDARGLLLFVSCFGIPAGFKNEELSMLIWTSNAKEIHEALRRSSVLRARIPEIIRWTVKHKMEVEAVDMVYTFGVEDQYFPRDILTNFLRESKEIWKRRRKSAQDSRSTVNEANKKHLSDLKSVIKCLEAHKIDLSSLLPGWQINKKILTLEREIADFDNKAEAKAMPKRKADEVKLSKNWNTPEVKRSRFTDQVLQQQKAASYADGMGSYERLMPTNLLDAQLSSHVNPYAASPSVLRGSGAGLLPESIAGSAAGGGISVLAAGVRAGFSSGSTGVQPTDCLYDGVRERVMVDSVGRIVNPSSQPYGWHGDAALNERLVHYGPGGQPASIGVSVLYRPSPSLEGFVGVLNAPSSTGVAGRASASDLYQFADAVAESEAYPRSSGYRQLSSMPNVLSAQHSSLY